jgi:hypothetical protein
MKNSAKILRSKAPEHLGDLDHIRYGLIIPYLESLGYEFVNGDSGGDRSTDEYGIYGGLEFQNPTTGKRLIIELSCKEQSPEVFEDEDSYMCFLRMATPAGRA